MASKNIELINTTYYASMHVPSDVKEILGKSRLRKTLKTGVKQVAEQRARRIIADWWDQINLARTKTGLKLDDVTREALIWKDDIASTQTDLEKEIIESVLDDQIEDLIRRFGAKKQTSITALQLVDQNLLPHLFLSGKYLSKIASTQKQFLFMWQMPLDLQKSSLLLNKLTNKVSESGFGV